MKSSSFGKAVFSLGVGTAASQVVGIVTLPLVVSIYTPESYGQYGVFFSTVAVLVSVAGLKLPWAVVSAHNSDVAPLQGVTLISSWIVALIGSAIALGRGDPALVSIGIGIAVAISAAAEALSYTANRERDFRLIGVSSASSALGRSSGQVGLGSFLPSSGLILGDLIGRGLQVLVLARHLAPLKGLFVGNISVIQRHSRFPLYSAPADLLNSLSYNLEVLVFASVFGDSAAGGYFLWVGLLSVPKRLVAGALWQVHYRSGTVDHLADLARSTRRRQVLVAKLSVTPFVMIGVAGPSAILWLGPQAWHPFAYLALPISLGTSCAMVVSAFSMFVILRRNRAELAFNGLLLLFKILALWAALALAPGSLYTAVWSVSGALGLSFLALGEWNWRAMGIPKWQFASDFLVEAVGPGVVHIAIIASVVWLGVSHQFVVLAGCVLLAAFALQNRSVLRNLLVRQFN